MRSPALVPFGLLAAVLSAGVFVHGAEEPARLLLENRSGQDVQVRFTRALGSRTLFYQVESPGGGCSPRAEVHDGGVFTLTKHSTYRISFREPAGPAAGMHWTFLEVLDPGGRRPSSLVECTLGFGQATVRGGAMPLDAYLDSGEGRREARVSAAADTFRLAEARGIQLHLESGTP